MKVKEKCCIKYISWTNLYNVEILETKAVANNKLI